MLVVIVFVLSNIITPIAGIPVGLLGGAYFLKRREEKKINNLIIKITPSLEMSVQFDTSFEGVLLCEVIIFS